MAPIRRIVLDVLKPHEPSMLELAERLADTDGVDGTNATMVEIDEEVENVKVTATGDDIDYDAVKREVGDMGGSVHSIDEIVCGEKLVEESKTPQD
ncbi:MAG: DUF211 domain-containing protein [Candidatus Nanohaloarchaeota archaeon QJJ-7]|nr:DUF211 domain-containing protein [Candidatus Nanohaloarchaeota archaeon QJJ-7]